MMNQPRPHTGRFRSALRRNLSAVLLLASLGLCVAPAARAQFTITISPVGPAETATSFLFSASGTNLTSSDGDFASGTLELNDWVINTAQSSQISGDLTFGGEYVLNFTGQSPFSFKLDTSSPFSNLVTPGAWSFAGDSSVFALMENRSYASSFNVGEYSITGGSGFFGDAPSGTLTVLASPVPEPATYAGLVGLAALGFCASRRRRSSAGSLTALHAR